MNFKTVDDTELVKHLKKGNASAFREIYNRFWLKLFNIGFHEIGTREEAKELVHNIFTSLWEKRERLTIKKLDVYLVVAIKNAAISYIRSNISKRKFQEYLIFNEISQSHSAEDLIMYSDLSKAVDKALQKLPEKTCQIFKLSRFENHSVDEIANIMRLNKKTVEYHITKSLKLLREELKKYQSVN